MTKKLLIFSILILALMGCKEGSKLDASEHETHAFTNELINESSPYLLQHAHNPVNWMPWGDAAFEKAKAEHKLVLISIGYSSCHWCHVMEHESFEDKEVAALMNEKFICIKVDREERPDVDQVYMDAVQFMTRGGGGWPLNCFTLPDGRPVYGGTYFQKQQWTELLNNLAYKFEKSPKEIENYAENVQNNVQQSDLVEIHNGDFAVSLEALDTMVTEWSKYFDLTEGGLENDLKFPLPNNYEFLMQYAYHAKDTLVMDQVDLTLTKMALGGIYDQVGGGFARYSTDKFWKVPHFEKMLYDNAQLVSLYSHAYQRTKNPLYKEVVYQTLNWVYREMMTTEGSFYSALDADSEGEEGKFYVWSKEELKAILSDDDYKFTESYYNIGVRSAWEGNYILLRTETNAQYADKNGMTLTEVNEKADAINKQLLEKRTERVRPGLDDKSLTSWNALMLTGFLDAYQAFSEPEFLQAAIVNAHWIAKRQLKEDGSLLHVYKKGESKIEGFLEDYCFTIEAFIKLYEATFNEDYLKKADLMATYAIAHFYDDKTGMFYFSSDNQEGLISRKMEITDNVIPASNSVMANILYDLGILLDKTDYKDKAKQMLSNVYGDMKRYSSSYSNWAILSLNLSHSYYEVAITGKDWKKQARELNGYYIPNKLLMGASTESTLAMLEGKFMDETTIFVCIEGACKMPTNSVSDALKQME